MAEAASRFFADERDRVDEAYHVLCALDEGEPVTAAERRRFDRTLADMRKKVVRPLARMTRQGRYRFVRRLPHARRDLVIEAMPKRMYEHYRQDERAGPRRVARKPKSEGTKDWYFEGVRKRASAKARAVHARVEDMREAILTHPRVMSRLGLSAADVRRAKRAELQRIVARSPAVLDSLATRKWTREQGVAGLAKALQRGE